MYCISKVSSLHDSGNNFFVIVIVIIIVNDGIYKAGV